MHPLPIRRRMLPAVLIALGSLAAPGMAQDTTTARPHERGVVGSARISLDASYAKPNFTDVQASGTVAPFVTEHWQVGIAPVVQVVSGYGGQYVGGGAAVIANYFPTAGTWRPYIGMYASQGGASLSTGYGAYGAQGGWLHFLSPSVALRAELRYRHSAGGPGSYESGDFYLTLDPYLFGRATQSLTTLPGFGVFDASVFGDFQMRPSHTLTANGTIAPFITRYLQTGVIGTALFTFDTNEGYHDLEWFGRAYLPIDERVLPFADGFIASHYISNNETERSHGGRAGLRTYLTAGVALDVALEWRHYGLEDVGGVAFARPEDRTVRAALTTQFRARRAGW